MRQLAVRPLSLQFATPFVMGVPSCYSSVLNGAAGDPSWPCLSGTSVHAVGVLRAGGYTPLSGVSRASQRSRSLLHDTQGALLWRQLELPADDAF